MADTPNMNLHNSVIHLTQVVDDLTHEAAVGRAETANALIRITNKFSRCNNPTRSVQKMVRFITVLSCYDRLNVYTRSLAPVFSLRCKWLRMPYSLKKSKNLQPLTRMFGALERLLLFLTVILTAWIKI